MDHSALVESRSIGRHSESRAERHSRNSTSHRQFGSKGWRALQFRKLKAYPFSIFFIVGNELCERFTYYGMKAVLILFLHEQLLFDENSSTAIFHAFSMLCYMLPIFGAIISDSCLGKYWTILTLSVVYCIGNVIMAISAIPFENARGLNIALAAVGMVVIAFGTGGIKPCVPIFGGEQFKEGQTDLLRQFFSIFYLGITIGSLSSVLLTPILRYNVHCFNTCRCYALAFGVPAVLMIVALLLFVAGTKFYVITKPKKGAGTLFVKVPLSIATAIYNRIKWGKVEGKKSLLLYACPRFSEQFMEDVRLILRLTVMFLPLLVFFALFNQQGSRWTLQATKMNGRLGRLTIQPDQMFTLSIFLSIFLIPIFETVIYPLLGKCNLLKKPLQRIVTGMLLASFAFVIAGVVQLTLQAGDKTLRTGETKLVMFNALPTNVPTSFRIEDMDRLKNVTISLCPEESKVLSNSDSLTPGNYSLYIDNEEGEGKHFQMVDKSITQIVVTAGHTSGPIAFITDIQEDIDIRPDGSHSSVQVINAFNGSETLKVILTTGSGETTVCAKNEFEMDELSFMDTSNWSLIAVGRYRYNIYTNNNNSLNDASDDKKTVKLHQRMQRGELNVDFNGGAVYMIVVTENRGNASSLVEEGEQYKVTGVEIDEPNSVSIFLQVPMYVIFTAGEVLVFITALEFAYSQAPKSMRAMCLAISCVTISLGDFIVIIVAEFRLFENRAIEFFFFAILMFLVTLIYAVMSFFYKYVDVSSSDGDKPLSHDSAYSSRSHDEGSALIASASNSRILAEPTL